jgi:enoyl-CoA hydratase
MADTSDPAATSGDEQVLHVSVEDGVATITLHRPQVRNALSGRLLSELAGAVAAAEHDESVAAIVLTGADPAFCAGLDLVDLASGRLAEAFSPDRSLPPWLQPPLAAVDGVARTTPLIGAVNGPAVTGGLELALGCDLLVASERARFADTHARVGILPGWGLTVLLPQAVGVRRAREMSATGNYVDASTALAWGLVNHVVPHAELLATARRLAADIASNDRRAVRALFGVYDAGTRSTGEQAWLHEAETAREWFRAGGGALDEVERRRRDVVGRGRSQTD